MFSFYEAAGVVTNLVAGMLGARWGIKTTLLVGLTVQLAGLGMLFGWQSSWSKGQAIIYVTASQMLCGIAKDLTKLGGKTVTKLVTPEGRNSSLFKLVSFITGWKNSLKGVGYFLGAATVGVKYVFFFFFFNYSSFLNISSSLMMQLLHVIGYSVWPGSPGHALGCCRPVESTRPCSKRKRCLLPALQKQPQHQHPLPFSSVPLRISRPLV